MTTIYNSLRMLEPLLETCGLKNSEQKIFLHLVKNGPGIASLIAKRTGLKRPTVYAIIESLMQKGIVIKQPRGKVNYFSTIPLSIIPKVFENMAKKRLNEIQIANRLMLPELLKQSSKDTHRLAGYEIGAMDSFESVYAQLEDTLLGGDFDAIFNPQTAITSTYVEDLVTKFLNQTAKNKNYIREITVAGAKTEWYKKQISNSNHIIKELPHDTNISSDIILLKGSVITSHYAHHQEVGIKITQKEFFEAMKTIFEILWKNL